MKPYCQHFLWKFVPLALGASSRFPQPAEISGRKKFSLTNILHLGVSPQALNDVFGWFDLGIENRCAWASPIRVLISGLTSGDYHRGLWLSPKGRIRLRLAKTGMRKNFIFQPWRSSSGLIEPIFQAFSYSSGSTLGETMVDSSVESTMGCRVGRALARGFLDCRGLSAKQRHSRPRVANMWLLGQIRRGSFFSASKSHEATDRVWRRCRGRCVTRKDFDRIQRDISGPPTSPRP